MNFFVAGVKAATTAKGMMAIGAGVQAAGSIQQGRAAEAEAKSAQNMANYNAAVQEREAKATRAATDFKQMRQAKEAERVKSSMLAKMGQSGIPGAGTNVLIQGEQAAELELENLLIGYEGELTAQRSESQAAADRLQGKIYKQKGKNLKTASYYKAGSSLLTGFGNAYA